jgi:dTMP kinase
MMGDRHTHTSRSQAATADGPRLQAAPESTAFGAGGALPAVSASHSQIAAPAAGKPARWRLEPRRGVLISVEGVWGAGKSTAARRLGDLLTQAGFSARVLHYAPCAGVIGQLSEFLETAPLRSRAGAGGYAAAHHAAVDVLLRLCREAHHHLTLYGPALQDHDAVILDHGVYSKIAYALAVLTETAPGDDPGHVLQRLLSTVDPWFLHPDLAVFLDVPWPLARERAIARGHGGGNPGALERLLFLPRFDAAYRHVLAAHQHRVARIRVGLRSAEDVTAEIAGIAGALLRSPLTAHQGSGELQPAFPS